MNSVIVFINKEIKEQLRTYKTLIVVMVLLLLGIMSPVFAKMMPDLISSMDIGFEISMPPPVYTDAFAQFFKNMTQIGIIVIILVFSGIVSLEKTKGTMILILTKRISRVSFLVSKFVSMVLLWTIGYLLSVGACLFYTLYLFPDAQLDNVWLSFFCLWLFVVLIIAITLLTSTLASNNYIGTIGAFVGWFLLLMSAYMPKVKEATPLMLSTWNLSIISGSKELDDLILPIGIGFLTILFLLFITCVLIKKQEI